MIPDVDEAELLARCEAEAKERLHELKEAAEEGARNIEVEHSVTIKRYYNASKELLRQGRNCAKENDFERAYVMLFRFSIFFIEKVASHEAFKIKSPEKTELKSECPRVLDEIEFIKKELTGRYQAEAEVTIRAEVAEQAAAAAAAQRAAAEAEARAAAEARQRREAADAAEALAVAEAADEAEAAARRAAAAAAAREEGAAATSFYCGECEPDVSEAAAHPAITYPTLATPPPSSSPSLPPPPAYDAIGVPPHGGASTAHGFGGPLAAPPLVPPRQSSAGAASSSLAPPPPSSLDAPVPMGMPLPPYQAKSGTPPVAGTAAVGNGGGVDLSMPPIPGVRPASYVAPAAMSAAAAAAAPSALAPQSGGLASLNMGSLSIGGTPAGPAAHVGATPSVYAAPSVVSAYGGAVAGGGALDLSLPTGQRAQAPPDPWRRAPAVGDRAIAVGDRVGPVATA